jgi:acyl-CoA synthetase (AMP-forming)/AMP-acid ligase II
MTTWTTLPDLVAHRAATAPDLVGYTFLPRAGEPDRLDYRTLHERVGAVASRLREHAGPGERALVLLPPGIDFVVAVLSCLHAGLIAVPCSVPHVGKTERRLEHVGRAAADARPTVGLTTPQLAQTLTALEGIWKGVAWVTDLRTPAACAVEGAAVSLDAPAIIQYSSGSTRAPRGVVLSQGNLIANIAAVHQKFRTSATSHGVIWLPPHHDMGLIGGVLGPIYGGFGVTLLSPVTFLHQPFRWLDAVSTTRATISGGPDFAYRLCVERVTEEQRARLDLSNWEVAFNGAEPVRQTTVDRFAETFAACGFRKRAFYPCYGLAEAPLIVTGPDRTRLDREPAAFGNRVACGEPCDGHEVRIIDPESLKECQGGDVGEIWVRGPSVAACYWNDPAETARAFGWTFEGRGPFLRSGDLGALVDGDLFVTGRLKDAIVISGRKYWAEDVEESLADLHPDLADGGCAAFSVDVDGDEHLAIVHEVNRHASPERHDDLVDAIRRRVADQWALPVHAVGLLKPGALPRTTSGKPRRFFCRSAFVTSTLDVWTPAQAGRLE